MPNALQRLRIINGNGPAEMGLQELMRRLRLMEEVGIEAEYVNLSDGKKGLAALLEGHGDVALQIGFGPALAAIEEGAKLKVIAGANLRTVHVVFASDPAVRTVRDLEGHTIGIGSQGALTHQLMTAILLKAGADLSKVRFVSIGNSAAVFEAVAGRVVDAGLGEVDNLHQENEFGIHALPDGNLWDELPQFTNQASYTTDRAIETQRDLLTRALAASAKLYRYICSEGSFEVFAAARQAAVPTPDQHAAQAQWKFYQERKPYALGLVIGEDRLRYMQEINIAMGLQTCVLPFGDVADMSVAESALRLV